MLLAQAAEAAGPVTEDTWVAQNIFFAIIALGMIVAAVRVVTTRNVVHAALWLVLVLAGAAEQFILLAAEFIATVQVIVYIGAIIVLFLFGIMLTRAEIGDGEHLDNPRNARLAIAAGACAMFALMAYVLWDAFEDVKFVPDTVQRTSAVSDAIFGQHLIAFEAVSVLLTAALIGAIVLARRD